MTELRTLRLLASLIVSLTMLTHVATSTDTEAQVSHIGDVLRGLKLETLFNQLKHRLIRRVGKKTASREVRN